MVGNAGIVGIVMKVGIVGNIGRDGTEVRDGREGSIVGKAVLNEKLVLFDHPFFQNLDQS